MQNFKPFFFSALSILSISIVSIDSLACSRILHVEKGMPVLVGRTMDFQVDMQTNLFVFPQGIKRSGLDPKNSLEWTAKYGSLVATAYDAVATDGLNEKGLAAHLLALHETNFGKRDDKIPGLSVFMWAQFYLDNFQTVDEAIRFTTSNTFQIIDDAELHLALEDALGDSAIIEYINGKYVIYHNSNYKVMTNSPTYDKQLENLKSYIGLGGKQPLPGSVYSKDRFVRAAYYEKYLPVAKSPKEEVMNVMSVVQAITAPYGQEAEGRPIYVPTIWESVLDLSNKIYYFHSTMSFGIVHANLTKFNLKVGSPSLKLDLVNNPELAGDVSDKFVEVKLKPKNYKFTQFKNFQ